MPRKIERRGGCGEENGEEDRWQMEAEEDRLAAAGRGGEGRAVPHGLCLKAGHHLVSVLP